MMKKVQTLIRANNPLIVIETLDEQRVTAALGSVAKSLDMGMRVWSSTYGFMGVGEDEASVDAVVEPDKVLEYVDDWSMSCLFMLRDFHPYLDETLPANVLLVRKIRDYMRSLRSGGKDLRRSMVMTVPPGTTLPKTLVEARRISWPLPDRSEIAAAVEGCLTERGESLDAEQRSAVIEAARGLTMQQVEDALAGSIIECGRLEASSVVAAKREVIEGLGYLEWREPVGDLSVVGGLDVLKSWMTTRKRGFSEAARSYGLRPPRGVMVSGVSGCGKSWTASVAGAVFGLPQLYVDVDGLFGGIVGETEKAVASLLMTLDAVAPCICVLEEIEKSLGGSSSSGDSGVSKRMLGKLLNYMQDSKSGVFWFATSNNVMALPMELRRVGRFNAIFWVDLPTSSEREEIFRIHLSRRNRDPSGFDVAALVKGSKDFTGAEIEGAIEAGMYSAFERGVEVETGDILRELSGKEPMAKTDKPQIDSMRKDMRLALRASSVEKSSGKSRFAELG